MGEAGQRLRRVFVRVAVAGLAALCHCSLLFGVERLDNGADAGNAGNAGSGGFDAPVGPANPTKTLDAGGPDASRDPAQLDANELDAGGDAAALDASDDGAGNDGTQPLDTGADPDALDAVAGDADDAKVGLDAAGDAGSLSVGLVAFYPFDEAGGSSSVDASGNSGMATLRGGVTFAKGLRGNAVTLSGNSQYVSLPDGIVSGLTACSISAWVYLNDAPAHAHLFDFGTGTSTYMFFSPGGTMSQFAITTGGVNMEQRLTATSLATGRWQHVVVTMTGVTGTLYVNGVAVAQNAAMTRTPGSLGNTTQNWLGRSQDPVDPYADGQIDELRIYNRALSAAEVEQLFVRR